MGTKLTNTGLDYNRAIKILDGVYWVGFYDRITGLHCNPYLLVEGDEAVVIDGGSRPDFPTVMMKILQTGIDPSQIRALIYQHYDPDLCGSVHNYEDLISRDDLKIISDAENNMFIRHYSVTSPLVSLESMDYEYRFSTGRTLRFIKTPYAHSGGSFTTFDEGSGILFTSDLFGSISSQWELFLLMTDACRTCSTYDDCPKRKNYCPVPDILHFHQRIMTSEKALRFALQQMAGVDFKMLAPQHGSLIPEPRDILTVFEKLNEMKGVGIDGVVGDSCEYAPGNLSGLEKRFGGLAP